MTFKDMCEQNGISYNTAYLYRKRHPELTNKQVI